jgi:hypothetical protein
MVVPNKNGSLVRKRGNGGRTGVVNWNPWLNPTLGYDRTAFGGPGFDGPGFDREPTDIQSEIQTFKHLCNVFKKNSRVLRVEA